MKNKIPTLNMIIGFIANALSILFSIFTSIMGFISLKFPYWCSKTYSYSYYSYYSTAKYYEGVSDGDVIGIIMIIVATVIFIINATSIVTKILSLKQQNMLNQSMRTTNNVTVSQVSPQVKSNENDQFEKIEKLNHLLKSGVITEEEFNSKKKQILHF